MLKVRWRQANTWEELRPSGQLPEPRYSHVAVWSDAWNGFFVFGGTGRDITFCVLCECLEAEEVS